MRNFAANAIRIEVSWHVTNPGNDRTVKLHSALRAVCLLILGAAIGARAGDADVPAGDGQQNKRTTTHWAFQPLRRPVLPTLKHGKSVRNPIDRFILSRLETKGITPSPETDRATLIRRVTLDLIGLPPTPAEVADFLRDARADAYERLVDRLLASHHYGERWARPWLDLCHYADTDGYLTDQPRPVAWRYRQWLLNALNRDLPFDQFTVEQLAGDLLPNATIDQRIATGFLRNTLSNREGGADLEEFRVEQVVDRTQIVGTTWLGLTVGCARCHDHKFDPIRQREFFGLYAYFNTADEVNLDAPLPGELERRNVKRTAYDRKRAELLKPVEKSLAELQSQWEKRLLEAADRPGRDHIWDRQWELLGLVWGGMLGEGQLEGTQIVRLEPAKRTQDQKDRLLDYFLKNAEPINPAKYKLLKLAELSGKLESLKQELPRVTRAPTMCESPLPRRTVTHIAGDFRRPGTLVEPGTPLVLPAIRHGSEPKRLTFAKWLTSEENPLPARVFVNRAWQEFFGAGLVHTTENFGVRGEPPTHPDLLDWLAAEFADPTNASAVGSPYQKAKRWSLKALHRTIVTSATYRQSSKSRPELVVVDPDNRLLARQASLRLSADQIRDSTLAVSGLLDRRIGGPSVFPPQPASVALEGFENQWKASSGPDRYRRGIYTYLQRLSPFAQNVTFDGPTLSQSCTRRERSNSPLQALTLLNDPVFFEAAQALAARLLRERQVTFSERFERAFMTCLCRPPTPREQARMSEYFESQVAILRSDPTAVGALKPPNIGSVAPVEAAAWTGIASVMLNLHEFITRE